MFLHSIFFTGWLTFLMGGIIMDIRKIVSDIVLEYIYVNIEDSDIKDETELVADLNIDSIIYIQIVVNVEERFGIEFDDDMLDMMTITTFGKLWTGVNDIISREGNNYPC